MSGVTKWTLDHRFIILGAVTACLFVSTVALAIRSKKCKIHDEDSTMTRESSGLMSSARTMKNNFYRLPRHVTPINYNLTLHPNILEKTFNGTVDIKLQVLQPTEKIILHSNKLSINSVKLRSNNGSVVVKSWRLTEDKRETLTVNMQNEIPIGNYTLQIKFAGRLDNGIIGFYASKLKNGGAAKVRYRTHITMKGQK